jgi:molybdate transport system substrate-binding protein
MRRLFFIAAKALLVVLLQGHVTQAADIKVLCASASAIAPVMDELLPAFERASGHTLTVRRAFGPVLSREIEAGAVFDVAILSLDVEDLVKSGRIVPGTRILLGRTGIGVGVRKGEPKPDVGTPDAFKRALLNARSVAYSGDGSSGRYFLGLLDRLGIADAMKGRLRPQVSGNSPARTVASGEVELAVTGSSIIAAAPSLDYAGPLPAELQDYVVFTGGLGVSASEPAAGRALLTFLTSDASAAVFKARGLEPMTP